MFKILLKLHILIAILGIYNNSSAIDGMPLNPSNWLGVPGSNYWHITQPGLYYLDLPEKYFFTNAPVAILVSCSNVTVDGKGTTISGYGPPQQYGETINDSYGVRVNGGLMIDDISVKNMTIKNKYFGIIYEYVNTGVIQNVTATNNSYGLYYWKTNELMIVSNSVTNNRYSGIVCDAHETINNNTLIQNNTITHNGTNGIDLWLSCLNHLISNNIIFENESMGLALSEHADNNRVTQNKIYLNSSGIWISNSAKNIISSNFIFSNENVGANLDFSTNAIIINNVIQDNGNAGVWLNQSGNNKISSNKIVNNRYWGIFLSRDYGGNEIYDNFLKNLGNAGFYNAGSNVWFSEPTSGKNIINGNLIGGNYWASVTQPGFSRLVGDLNCDGLADQTYPLSPSNYDKYPLHIFNQLQAVDVGFSSINNTIFLVGVNNNGDIFSLDTKNLLLWNKIPGQLDSIITGDFDGNGEDDIAGISFSGNIFYSLTANNWILMPGTLSEILSGDFDKKNKGDELIGLAYDGTIYYSSDLISWTNVPGNLKSMLVVDLNFDGVDDLLGLSPDNHIYFTLDLKNWTKIPGELDKVYFSNLASPGKSYLLAGLTLDGDIYYSTDSIFWNKIPGKLVSIAIDDIDGDDNYDIVGINNNNNIYITSNYLTWTQVPGKLNSLLLDDFDQDGLINIGGLTTNGSFYYLTRDGQWRTIGGHLLKICY